MITKSIARRVIIGFGLVVIPLWLVGLLAFSSPVMPSAGSSDPPIVNAQPSMPS